MHLFIFLLQIDKLRGLCLHEDPPWCNLQPT